MARPRALVIGGLGYLGSRIAAHLVDSHQVTVTARSLSSGRTAWLDAYAGRVEAVQYDSRRMELPRLGEVDLVVNLAAPGAAEAARDPVGSCAGALHTVDQCLLMLAADTVERLIHFSSFHVYGGIRRTYLETDEPQPRHPYGEVHFACEQRIAQRADARVSIIRPTNVVGAPAHPDLGPQEALLFLDLCRRAVEHRELVLRSVGTAHRDFLCMTDFLAAVRLIAERPVRGAPIVNVSHGNSTRLDALAQGVTEAAADVLGAPVALTLGTGADPYEQPFSVSNTKLRALGWEPVGRFDHESRDTVRFFQQQAER